MPSYRVTWEIDLDADSPREAAEKARAIQLRHDSTATVFNVMTDGSDIAETVDLTPEEA